MDRKQMLERVVTVMLSEYIEEDLTPRAWDYMLAEKVLDAILPQITTVEELEALPAHSKLISADGRAWELRHGGFDRGGPWLKGTTGEHQHYGVAVWLPLTVVWRP